MSDDFSEVITNASCYTINNQTTIYAYRNNTRYSYSQVGGKWYETATNTYTSIPVNSTCYSYANISTLSSYSYMLPIYYMIAFMLAVFVFFFAYRIFWVNLVSRSI